MPKKGSEFERKISKRFSLWWTHGERDDVFWRTAGSGAWVTTRKKSGKKTSTNHGDMQAIDPIGQPFVDIFYIEMKRGYKYDVLALLDEKRSKACELHKFWTKLRNEANEVGKQPLLILKRDQYEPMIMMRNALYIQLRTKSKIHLCDRILVVTNICALSIIPLDSFFTNVDPDNIKAHKDEL